MQLVCESGNLENYLLELDVVDYGPRSGPNMTNMITPPFTPSQMPRP